MACAKRRAWQRVDTHQRQPGLDQRFLEGAGPLYGRLVRDAANRQLHCSTAASGFSGNPMRRQNGSRIRSHCALGGKHASKRPKFFAPSIARLPDLVAHLEEQRPLPAAAVGHAVVADGPLQRRRCEAKRCVGCQAAASRAAAWQPVDPQRRQRRISSACRSAVCLKRTSRSGPSASSSLGRTGPRASAPPARPSSHDTMLQWLGCRQSQRSEVTTLTPRMFPCRSPYPGKPSFSSASSLPEPADPKRSLALEALRTVGVSTTEAVIEGLRPRGWSSARNNYNG